MSRSAAISALVLAILAIASPAGAGGGGENVLLVVNPNSWASLSVANHYAALRGIPAANIVSIPFALMKRDDTCDIDAFREQILGPVLKHISDNKLDHVDYIIYSSDFPTAIDFSKENKYDQANEKLTYRKWASASITGLTFLHDLVMSKDVNGYLVSWSNYYSLLPKISKDAAGATVFDTPQPRAFSARRAYGKLPDAADGRKYHLSMVLGLTSGRGNSVSEVVACLKRSAAADGTRPKGTWYYMSDGGIRTRTRAWGFASAVPKLESIGQRAEVINYVMPKDLSKVIAMPRDKDDIIGAMLGQQFPSIARSGSKTLPGAIVENLTSEGGIMYWGGGQVPISEFIRFGAAGTAGTVAEPTALQWKFPTAFLFYHYAMGASLAEAFYLSVQGPYQLLIVGDPLCQPFADLPRIEGPPPGLVDEKSARAAKGVAPEGQKIERVEFILDGKLIVEGKEAPALADGYHELTASAVCEGPMQWRKSAQYGFVQGKAPEFSAAAVEVTLGQTLKLRVSMPGAKKIEFLHLGRVIASADADKAEAEVDSTQLGLGPARLLARALVGDKTVKAQPVDVNVAAPAPIAAAKADDTAAWSPGALLTGPDIAPTVVTDMRKRNPLAEAKAKPGAAFMIAGCVDAPADDVYQFQVWYDGKLSIRMDGQLLPLPEGKGWRLAPFSLAKGMHRFAIEGVANDNLEIDVRFGGPGSRSLGDKNCRFPSAATQPQGKS